MAYAPPHTSSEAEEKREEFFTIHELLHRPELAVFYTDMLLNSPTTVGESVERVDLSSSAAHNYAKTLQQLGAAEQLDEKRNRAILWEATPVGGVWNGAEPIGPVMIAVYGAIELDEDIELFVERHGKAKLGSAIAQTVEYLRGNTSRRGAADALDVPAVEGIAITQALEKIVYLLKDRDPSIPASEFDVSLPDRALDEAPYMHE
ncbi:DUF7437 domain-containing protein [Halostagnicola kamekurae]|uniref:DUF7437 domain-containing protein n=1 Tax=Halostagnicola kamekurae TaxID=619731 RepID=A0A1I6SN85_9EURY|nr:hypothetical protein [Halostagnicola kamekurae]SFS78405.1 hypothetical protein SAMN04488556_2802 [Halostagnicola kamekurae]